MDDRNTEEKVLAKGIRGKALAYVCHRRKALFGETRSTHADTYFTKKKVTQKRRWLTYKAQLLIECTRCDDGDVDLSYLAAVQWPSYEGTHKATVDSHLLAASLAAHLLKKTSTNCQGC